MPDSIIYLASGLDTAIVADVAPTDRWLVGSQDPDTAVAELHDLVAANVHSAIVLGQVLRLPEELPVPEAIDVESLTYSTLLGAPGP